MSPKYTTDDKYLVIPVELPENIIATDRDELQNILEGVKPEDMKVEFDGGNMVIFLNRVDLPHLKELQSYQANRLLDILVEQIESIRSYGIRGGKRIYFNYNQERKVKDRKQKEQSRSKHFYAEGHAFSRQENELPESLLNRIICDDSERLLKKFPDNSIDLILTSPPYNFGLEYQNQDDDHFWEHYFEKLFRILDECVRVLKWGGRLIINVQPLFSDYIPTHHIISNHLMGQKLIWKGEILWEKHNYNCKYTAWGSWKSPSSPYLKYTWEFLEIFSKGSLKKPGSAENIDLTAEEFKEWVVARWSIAPERSMEKWGHPAMFPEELARRAIKLFSYKGDIVLDPFNGVGTTTAVAKKLGRRFVGIDISEEYCRIAENRLKHIQFMDTLF